MLCRIISEYRKCSDPKLACKDCPIYREALKKASAQKEEKANGK